MLQFLLALLALLALITIGTLAYAKYKENQLQAKAAGGGYRVEAIGKAGEKIAICKHWERTHYSVGVIGTSYVKKPLTVEISASYNGSVVWSERNIYYWGPYVYSALPAGANAYVDAQLGTAAVEGKIKLANLADCY